MQDQVLMQLLHFSTNSSLHPDFVKFAVYFGTAESPFTYRLQYPITDRLKVPYHWLAFSEFCPN
jgi:hypothetical protein